MGLSTEQRAQREGKLTASRVAVLMSGDKEGILRLYREMIGELQEENLDDVWPVQLGAATEQLSLDWYERRNKRLLIKRGEVVTSKRFEWAAATLDGFDPELNCPVECKHVGGFEPTVVIIDRYQPQMQWQMMCTDTTSCALSVIVGAKEPVVDFIDSAPAYIAEMVDRAEHFMMCVALREPPVQLPQIMPPVDPTASVDMNGNNRWAANANCYIMTKEDRDKFEEAKKTLKAMVPENALRAYGHGLMIYRDRRRALHVREES
ncbi:MAG TPA: YqaJ viral recombinase family protein [Steroidobacteraceae bacterium]|nr:YqaJ viral recombinase family protein [Steroidobacteraceae bacterium]